MVRLAPAAGHGGEDGYGLMSSAYIDKATGRFVTVIVNYGESPATAAVDVKHLPDGSCLSSFKCYETSSRCNLKYVGEYACGNVPVPARSVVTLVSDYLCKKKYGESDAASPKNPYLCSQITYLFFIRGATPSRAMVAAHAGGRTGGS